MKLLAYSLWGAQPRYLVGAVRNAELARELYPGWICRFYVGTSVPLEVRSRLAAFDNTQVRLMDTPGDWRGLLWRFFAAQDAETEILLSRDTDSRLSMRERCAVDEWLRSGTSFHIMRDHPWHATLVLGGLWGAKRTAMRTIAESIQSWPAEDRLQTDQEFLQQRIYPQIEYDSLIHDEFYGGVPFPTRRRDFEFVGATIDECDRPDQRQVQGLREAIAAQRFPVLRNTLERAAFRLGLWPALRRAVRGLRVLRGNLR